MYLYVLFMDMSGMYEDLMYGLDGSDVKRKRVAKIKLTEDQIRQLQPRIVGDHKENVSILSLQEE